MLAGLASWKIVHAHVMTARPGRYGQVACNVRLSHYIQWNESVMPRQSQAGTVSSSKPHAESVGASYASNRSSVSR